MLQLTTMVPYSEKGKRREIKALMNYLCIYRITRNPVNMNKKMQNLMHEIIHRSITMTKSTQYPHKI